MSPHDPLYSLYLEILRTELVPATGCTEPIAIAYAAAVVRQTLQALPDRVLVQASGNLIKNVKSVYVPNTDGQRGMEAAVAIGLIGGDASRELEVIASVDPVQKVQTAEYLARGVIAVEYLDSTHPFDLKLTVYKDGHSAMIHLQDSHTNIVELKKDGVSYTVETLRELKKQYPDRNILLAVGADMFLTLREWKEAAEIMTLCEPCVYDREHSAKRIRAYAEGLKRDFGVETRFLRGANVDLSSTELRSALERGENAGSRIPRAVRGIIDDTGVYRSDEYRLALYRRESERLVEEKRFNHILRVEKAAIELAERYGADVYKARAAALLHDVTKRKTHEEQMAMAREYGIPGADEFDKSPKVAHAFTAAAYAEHRFLVSDTDLLNAIRYHTTGRAGMSLLEKIIFLADGIEEGRKFEGVGEIREAASESLDRAMLISLEKTQAKIIRNGAYMHPYTAEAIEYFKSAVGNNK